MTLQKFFSLSILSSDRLAWIDYAKGIAIAMVVVRHLSIGLDMGGVFVDPFTLDLFEKVGLTFRMPLFFLLSGIFFRKSIQKHSSSGYILHKVHTIIYPYLIWSFLIISMQIAMGGYVNSNMSWVNYFDIFFRPWGHLWFLVALFNVSVLYLVIYVLSKGKHIFMIGAGLVFYFTANYFMDYPIAFHLLRLFIFFVMGDLVANAILDKKNHSVLSSKPLMLMFTMGAIVGEWLLFNGIGLGEAVNDKWRNGTVALLAFSIIGSSAFIWISYRLSIMNSKYWSWIRIFGQHSLYIYLLHPIFGSAIRILMVYAFGINDFWTILIISQIACLILPIYFYRVCKSNFLEFLFTPKPKFKATPSLNSVSN